VIVFAAAFDKWVVGHEMGAMSLAGRALIVGSAVWVVLTKNLTRDVGSNLGVRWEAHVEKEALPMVDGQNREIAIR
jgi:hypothetical protein